MAEGQHSFEYKSTYVSIKVRLADLYLVDTPKTVHTV